MLHIVLFKVVFDIQCAICFQGAFGIPGYPGLQGKTGLAGDQGKAGVPGKAGRAGAPGPQGQKGAVVSFLSDLISFEHLYGTIFQIFRENFATGTYHGFGKSSDFTNQ